MGSREDGGRMEGGKGEDCDLELIQKYEKSIGQTNGGKRREFGGIIGALTLPS